MGRPTAAATSSRRSSVQPQPASYRRGSSTVTLSREVRVRVRVRVRDRVRVRVSCRRGSSTVTLSREAILYGTILCAYLLTHLLTYSLTYSLTYLLTYLGILYGTILCAPVAHAHGHPVLPLVQRRLAERLAARAGLTKPSAALVGAALGGLLYLPQGIHMYVYVCLEGLLYVAYIAAAVLLYVCLHVLYCGCSYSAYYHLVLGALRGLPPLT